MLHNVRQVIILLDPFNDVSVTTVRGCLNNAQLLKEEQEERLSRAEEP